MLSGRVTAEKEAVVELEVLGEARAVLVDAGIDTGYNGFLTLPASLIEELELPFAGTAGAELGDGHEARMDVYLAAVRWGDGVRDILVLEAPGGALLGMAMLEGSRVTLDVEENGTVWIEPLSEIRGSN